MSTSVPNKECKSTKFYNFLMVQNLLHEKVEMLKMAIKKEKCGVNPIKWPAFQSALIKEDDR